VANKPVKGTEKTGPSGDAVQRVEKDNNKGSELSNLVPERE